MDKSYLEELIAERLSLVQMAERCNCNLSTVKRGLKKYGLKTQRVGNPDYDSLDKSYLEGLISQGFTRGQIAEQCNRSKGSINYWFAKYGLSTMPALLDHLCTTCGESDPNKFSGDMRRKCKACQIIARTQRLRVVKERFVRELGGKCVRCGYNKCVAGLHFHHKDPLQKDLSFKDMAGGSYERRKAELEKCELLCANCHTEVHYKVVQGSLVVPVRLSI